MRKFKTPERIQKITAAAIARQFSLRVVIENIHDAHNVSAIFRTCDAVGVPKVTLLYTKETFPKINKVTSASANKWIDIEKYDDALKCVDALKKEGFKIFASYLDRNARNLYDIDLTEKVALIFGNEHRGISDEVKKYADVLFYIPMRGMVQSLNVSVAAAVTLYESLRQRSLKGMYEKSELSNKQLNELIDKWCSR